MIGVVCFTLSFYSFFVSRWRPFLSFLPQIFPSPFFPPLLCALLPGGATMIMILATHYRRKAMMSFIDHRSHVETS